MTKSVVAKSWSLHEWSDGTYRSWPESSEDPGDPQHPELPYELPDPGYAVAIGENTAEDIAPSAWTLSAWNMSLWNSYGGGAFVPYYSSIGAYVIGGCGGHNHPDFHGAAVFDFDTALWTRLDNDDGVSLKNSEPYAYSQSESNGSPWFEVSGTPVPLPAHPYATLVGLPRGDKGSLALVTRAGVGTESGTTSVAHRFDLATRKWSRIGTSGGGRAAFEGDAILDIPRNCIWFTVPDQHNYQTLVYLDLEDDTWATTSSHDWPSSAINGYNRVMLHDGLLIRNCGSNGLWCYDPDTPSSGWFSLTVTGSRPTSSNRWARHSDGNWYSIPTSGGNTLARIIPPSNPISGTWVIDSVSVSGETLPGKGGDTQHYTNFFYVPSIDCLAWVPGGDNPVYLIRPS